MLRVIVLVLTLSTVASASPFHSLRRNLARNWQLYTADGLNLASGYYDAHSSTFCQPNCVELSPLLGPHPNPGQFLTVGLSTALVQVVYNHLVWHFAPTRADREIFLWTPTIGLTAQKAWSIRGNYEARP